MAKKDFNVKSYENFFEQMTEKTKLLENKLDRLLKYEDSYLERTKAQVVLEEEKLSLLDEQIKYTERIEFLQQQKFLLENELFAIAMEQVDTDLQRLDHTERRLNVTEKLADLTKELSKHDLSNLTDRAAALKEEYDQKVNTLKIQKKILESSENILEATLGVGDAWRSTTTGLIGTLLKSEQMFKSFKMFSEHTMKNFMDNAGPSFLNRMQEATVALGYSLDSTRAEFVKATGAGSDQVNNLLEQSRRFRFLGVTINEAGEATTALYQDMVSFNKASEAQKLSLIENVAILQNFGVSVGSAAKIAGELDATMGMTTDQISKFNRELFALSGPGLSTTQIFEDFATLLPKIQKHGKDSIKVFKDLAAQTRVLQINTTELFDIAEGFDMYDEAATKVGTLNAALGGDYLNALDLVNKSEEQRIETLRQGFQASGKSWDNLNKHERMLVANTLGISDMTTASKLFSQSMAEYNNELAKVKNSYMTPKELEERSKMTQTIEDNVKSMSESFAVSFYPMIEMLNSAMQLYGSLDAAIQKASGGTIGLGTAITAVFLAIKAFGVQMKIATFLTGLNTAANANNAASQTAMAAAAQTTSTKMKANAAMIAAVGAAVAGIGVGVAAAAGGFSLLSTSLKDLKGEQLETLKTLTFEIFTGMALLAGGLILVATASGAAAVPILAVGGAVALMGVGVAVAAAGTSLLADALGRMKTESIEAITNSLIELGKFTWQASLISGSLPLIALGYTSLAASIALLSGAISMLDVDKLERVNGSFSRANYSMTTLMASFDKLTPEKVEKVIIPTMKAVQQTVQVAGQNQKASDVLDKVVQVTNTNTSKETTSSPNIEVKVYIGNEELKSYVKKVVSSEIDLRK